MYARLYNFRNLYIAIVCTRMTTRIFSSTLLNTLVVFVTSLVFFSYNRGMTEFLAFMTTL
jgi:hypothetical protein